MEIAIAVRQRNGDKSLVGGVAEGILAVHRRDVHILASGEVKGARLGRAFLEFPCPGSFQVDRVGEHEARVFAQRVGGNKVGDPALRL